MKLSRSLRQTNDNPLICTELHVGRAAFATARPRDPIDRSAYVRCRNARALRDDSIGNGEAACVRGRDKGTRPVRSGRPRKHVGACRHAFGPRLGLKASSARRPRKHASRPRAVAWLPNGKSSKMISRCVLTLGLVWPMLVAAVAFALPYLTGRRLSNAHLNAFLFVSLWAFPAVLCSLFDLLPTKWPGWIRSIVAATGGLLAVSPAVAASGDYGVQTWPVRVVAN